MPPLGLQHRAWLESREATNGSLEQSDYEFTEDRADQVAHECDERRRELLGQVFAVVIQGLMLEVEQLLRPARIIPV